MAKRRPDNPAHTLELDGGVLIARRETRFLPDGSYVFEDALDVKGELTAKVITCAAWLLELYTLDAGELSFLSADERVRPTTRRFGVFYPPYTISQPCFRDARGRLLGVAGTAPLPDVQAAAPFVFETAFDALPASHAPVLEVLRAGACAQSIEMNPRPSLLSLRAKRLIDEHHLVHPSMARVAARLGVTPAHLSRQFKRDYGMSPSQYLRQLRVADAPLRLARGEEIVRVSQEVGYNDLSRFYKQFRKTTKTSPGACQTLMRPERARRK